jgi:outer membrane protein insertion porin family
MRKSCEARDMRGTTQPVRWPFGLSVGLALGLVAMPVLAEPPDRRLELEPAPDLTAFADLELIAVQVETEDRLWPERIQLRSVRPGDPATAEVARRAIGELTETGRFAEIRAYFDQRGDGVILVLRARPRRIVSSVIFEGSKLDSGESERALGIVPGDDTTAAGLDEAAKSLVLSHHSAGYSEATVRIVTEATDDPMRVLLRVQVKAGPPDRIRSREFILDPLPAHPALLRELRQFPLGNGDRTDRDTVQKATEALTETLVQAGFYEATVQAEVTSNRVLRVEVNAGPKYTVKVEGAQSFDARTLEEALLLTEEGEVSTDLVESRLTEYYQRYGFYDVRIHAQKTLLSGGQLGDLRVRVIEGAPLSVVARHYPCLGTARTKADVDREVNGVLREHFAEPHLVGPPESQTLALEIESERTHGGAPLRKERPFESYSQKAFSAVREHLTNLLQAEGYLKARVEPEVLVRRSCAPNTGPNVCRPVGERYVQAPSCAESTLENAPAPGAATCVPNARTRCEPEAEVVMPIIPGPLTTLTDITVEGNQVFTRSEIIETLGLKTDAPVRRADLDRGLSRVRDLYAEAAYAFAEVKGSLDVSADGTRARLMLEVSERKPVRVSRIIVEGASRTREGLIRRRIALIAGGLYRTSLVRRTQDQVESLGVFTSVSISLEDPRVPAREKNVIVSVTERLPQYLDLKAGLSSGDGFRVGFEYGHRNLGREAIQLTVRSQLGLRPPFLIVEPDVRELYSKIELGELLERRNSISLSIPEVGLGPKFRFEVEALDLRDNQRDYAQVRDAFTPRLLFRASRAWNFALSASVERNFVSLFALLRDRAPDDGLSEREQLEMILSGANLRVPEGTSLAFAQELAATWDRRNRALAPTEGTLLGATVEHVTAIPIETGVTCKGAGARVFDPTCSELLRLSGRASIYFPLAKSGLVLALGLKAGIIGQLRSDSSTYPDRLFFMGGVDTLRGFPQDSVVPEDLAKLVLAPGSELGIDGIVLRGGDLFWNPRAEVRIPLGGNLETAIFVDSGNVWLNPKAFNAGDLRYAIGTGLRYQTPIGPLVFDYGFNVERVLDGLFPDRPNQRSWEALGAFHFSIGYF